MIVKNLFVLFSLLFNQINCDESVFMVIGSKLLRLEKTYRASVTYSGYTNETILQIGIISNAHQQNDYKLFKNVTLSGNGVQNIDFDLENPPQENYYNLVVKSANFNQSKIIWINNKKFSVFTQTDKSIYKPSDLIQLRILVLDDETKPFNDIKSVEVYITDGADNRVKQFDNVKFTTGVYQNELQLSDSPVLGKWKIHININGEKVTKEFEVAEYVLPKFEFTIDTNPNVCQKDGKIYAQFIAKYTFGKIAKGNASIIAKKDQPSWKYINDFTVWKTIDIDGKKMVEFDLKNDFGIHEYSHYRTVKFLATYTDQLSGKQLNATASVYVYKNCHKIELTTSSSLKPGLPYKIAALVTDNDGVPITNKIHPVKFIIDANINQKESYLKEYEVSLTNGYSEISIDIPSNIDKINIEVKYLNASFMRSVWPIRSQDDQYIQAELLTKKPSLQNDIEIQIHSTKDIDNISVQILSKRALVDSKFVTFTSTKQHILTITPNTSMLPKATIVIFYIALNGKIIYDEVTVDFGIGIELTNHIDLKLSKDEAKPGEDMQISISTRSNSFVGLLGVDQSVLLLKKGNDIEKSTVFNEIEKYNSVNDNSNDFYFGNSQTIVISNAKNRYDDSTLSYEDDDYGDIDLKISIAIEMNDEEDDGLRTKSLVSSKDIKYINGNIKIERKPVSKTQSKPVEIREEFPETWLFESFHFDSNESTKIISKKVPDTITSWVITGFSVDPLTGLGLTQQPTKLNVFQPFFVTTNLPYSIKRGEVVAIPITVFNYLENDQKTQVTLFNKGHEFEFVEVAENSELRSKRALESEKTKTVDVKSDEGATILFMIRPLKAGQILIKVTAQSDLAGDGIQKRLRVEPEGVTQYMNEGVFIDLKNDEKFSKKIELKVPANAVEDSTKIEASVIGDILGPTISNLHKLIKLPYGCGEQNMINFVPNIIILDYLTNLNKLTPEIEMKAKQYMEVGYQRELTYKHYDGSYSSFGESYSRRPGSTWLTAFVAKSFNQASKYIHIDNTKITEALNFLARNQNINGSFSAAGYVSIRSEKDISLTAYTLITFLENKIHNDKYKNVIDKALNYIVNNFDEIDDIYSLAIATYAMQLANHHKKGDFLEKLNSKAINENGEKYWKKNDTRYNWYRPNSVNIEMTAYAMLANIEAYRESESVEIMKWLVKQRNENGGFQSTQDTIVGLQALSKLAEKISSVGSDFQITIKSDDRQVAAMNVNTANALILQKHELPSDARHFEVEASGKGSGILQISYKYNLDDANKLPRFVLKPQVEETSNDKFLHLTVCTNFVADAEADKSNMAIMEVSLPSGFTFDSDHLSELLSTKKVRKVETKEDDTIVMVYFDDISIAEICPEFKAYRTHGVAKLKQVPIVVYDYYDNSRHAREFYNPPEISLCDICENEIECQNACEVAEIEIN